MIYSHPREQHFLESVVPSTDISKSKADKAELPQPCLLAEEVGSLCHQFPAPPQPGRDDAICKAIRHWAAESGHTAKDLQHLYM